MILLNKYHEGASLLNTRMDDSFVVIILAGFIFCVKDDLK